MAGNSGGKGEVKVDGYIKITGIQLGSDITSPKIKIDVHKTHLNSELATAKKKAAEALKETTAFVNVKVTKTALTELRRNIREGIEGIKDAESGQMKNALKLKVKLDLTQKEMDAARKVIQDYMGESASSENKIALGIRIKSQQVEAVMLRVKEIMTKTDFSQALQFNPSKVIGALRTAISSSKIDLGKSIMVDKREIVANVGKLTEYISRKLESLKFKIDPRTIVSTVNQIRVYAEKALKSIKISLDAQHFQAVITKAVTDMRANMKTIDLPVIVREDTIRNSFKRAVKAIKADSLKSDSDLAFRVPVTISDRQIAALSLRISQGLWRKKNGFRLPLTIAPSTLKNVRRQILDELENLKVPLRVNFMSGAGFGMMGGGPFQNFNMGGAAGGSGGGGGDGKKGKSRFGDPKNAPLTEALEAAKLKKQIDELTIGIKERLNKSLTGTRSESRLARQEISALYAKLRKLRDILKVKQRSVGVDLANASLKDAARIAREAAASIKLFSKTLSGRMRQAAVIADKLNVPLNRVMENINRIAKVNKITWDQAYRLTLRYTDQVKKANNEVGKLPRLLSEVSAKAMVFRLASTTINTFTGAIRGGISFLIDYESSLRDINKIQQLTRDGVDNLSNSILKMAMSTGLATNELTGIIEELSRAGLEARGFGAPLAAAKDILIGVQGTTLNASEATEIYIQAIGQVEAKQRGVNQALLDNVRIFDILGRVEDITASKASDVAQAFKRSGASLVATGATFEQITALISVTQERTRRGAEVIGTSFKTIATRISNPASEASKALRSIGVETVDASGKLRNIFDIIQDTARAFETLTDAEQASISATVAGVRQVEIFRNIIGGAGRQANVLAEAQSSSGDAARKQREEQQKVAVSIQRVKASFESFANTLRQAGLDSLLKSILSGLEEVVNAMGSVVGDGATGLALAIASIGGLLTKNIVSAIRKLVGGFSKFFSLTSNGAMTLQRELQKIPIELRKIQAGYRGVTGAVETQIAAQRKASMAGIYGQVGGRTRRQRGLAGRASRSVGRGAVRLSDGADNFLGTKRGTGAKIGGAAAAVTAISLFGDSIGLVEDSALQTTASMTALGALMFGPFGAAIGAIVGAYSSLNESLRGSVIKVDDVDKEFLRLAGRFGDVHKVMRDQTSFNSFVEAAKKAKVAMGELSKSTDALSEGNLRDKATRVADKIRGASVNMSSNESLADARKRMLSTLSATIGEVLDQSGLDLSIADIDISDKQNSVTKLLVETFAQMFETSSDEAFRRLNQMVADETFSRGQGEVGLIKQLQRERDRLILDSQADAFLSRAFNFRGGYQELIDPLQAEIDARIAALGDTSRDGAMAIADAMIEMEKKRRAKIKATQIDPADLKASRGFEVMNVTASYQDLLNVIKETGPIVGKFKEEFIAVGKVIGDATFSQFANAVRKGLMSLTTSANDLESTRRQLLATSKESAKVEAELAAKRLETVRETSTMSSASSIIEFLRGTSDTLTSLGRESEGQGGKFIAASKNIISSIQGIASGALPASKALDDIKVSLANLAAEDLGRAESEQILDATNKLFELSNQLLADEKSILEAVLDVREKNMAAVKEQIDNIKDETDKRSKLNDLQELSNSVMTSQLTGLEAYVSQLSDMESVSRARIATLREELVALSALDQAGDFDGEIGKRILEVNQELQKNLFESEKQGASLRASALDAQLKRLSGDASFDKGIREKFLKLNDLLAGDPSSRTRQDPNKDFKNIRSELQYDLARISESMSLISDSTLPAIEKEKKLVELRREQANVSLDAAIAEMELLQERRDALEALAKSLVDNKASIQDARNQITEANRAIGEAFLGYLDAVQQVISSTVNYRKQLSLASIEADRIRGKFGSVNDRLKATVKVFNEAESAARRAGAGEKMLADLRKESIQQQISLLNEMLNKQSGEASSYFTSSRGSQSELFRGIQAISSLVGSGLLSGGNINDLGNQLMSMPEETRGQIDKALSTLQNLGVGVGGMTADQIRNSINEAVLGTSDELGIDPLTQVQERIAMLTEQQASLQLDAIVAANEQVRLAKDQLSETRASRSLAEIGLARIQEEGAKIAYELVKLNSSMEVSALGNDTVTSNKLYAGTRVGNMGDAMRSNGENLASTRGAVNSASLSFANVLPFLNAAQINNQSNIPSNSTESPMNEAMLRELKVLLKGSFDELVESLTSVFTDGVTALQPGLTQATTAAKTEFNITVTGEQAIRVTGITEGVQQIVDTLANTFGPFITEQQARDQFVSPILDRVNHFLQLRGLPPLEFQ